MREVSLGGHPEAVKKALRDALAAAEAGNEPIIEALDGSPPCEVRFTFESGEDFTPDGGLSVDYSDN